MKRSALTATLLAACAAIAMGSTPPPVAEPTAPRAIGEGTMAFGHDDEGRGLLRFQIEKGESITGTLLFAAEDHHERFPDVVVRLGTFDEATFGPRSVTFSGPGRLHDEPVMVAVTARDRAGGDRFSIKCTDPVGGVVFEASGELFRGDITIDAGAAVGGTTMTTTAVNIRSLVAGAVVSVGLAAGAAHADFESDNVTLLSHLPPEVFPGAPSRGNDCWGYVSPSGREYALMGMRNGLGVVEITDPSFPTIIASVSHAESNWSDVKTYQTFAYVVNEELGGFDVIDLSDVDNGTVTLVQRVTEGGVQSSHNVAIDDVSGFLYLCGSNIANGRLVAFDLADPANPTFAGSVPSSEGEYCHDAQVVTYTSGPNAGKQIAFGADGAFGMEVYDVTDKSNMVRLSTTTYPNLGYAHQCWLSGDRQYLYLNDELDGVDETVVFDVTNLSSPKVAGAFGTPGEAIDHNLYWHDGFIYEAQYTQGLRIYDATADPVNPTPVGSFDTFTGSDAAEFSGAWSVYPFFPSGNMLISTKNEGLFVVRPGPAPLTFEFPFGLPARLDPAGDSIVVRILSQGGQQLAPGTPKLHYDAGSGLVEVPMTDLGSDRWEGAFGPLPCGQFVQFFVSAKTTSNITMTDPPSAPTATHGLAAALESSIALNDAMEFDLGWIAGAPGDTATIGVWTRVEPQGTAAQPEADHTAAPGELCYVTGQGNPNGLAGDVDVDDGYTTLISPLFDLSATEDAIISYWRWFSNDWSQIDADEGQFPNEDVFVIDISNDNGGSWTNLETVGPTGPDAQGGWRLAFFNVADVLPPTDQVRLRFVASDTLGPSVVEAGVDDVRVERVTCIGDLVGDVNESGAVDIDDIVEVILAWGPCFNCGDCPTDLDGNCATDIDDLVIVVLNFSSL